MIDEKIFSFVVGDGNMDNYFTIGGYDLQSYARGDLHWHKLKDPKRWSVNFTGLKIGEQRIYASTHIGMVDSGASFLMMPENDFMQLFNSIKYTHGCNKYYMAMEIVFCRCTAQTIN